MPLNRQSVRDRAKRHGLNPADVFTTIAYNQLLQRLGQAGGDTFMLKGGQALHVRGASSRTTRDMDVRGAAQDARITTNTVLNAAATDLGDGLFFTVKNEPRELRIQRTGGNAGFNLGFVVRLAGQYWAELSVDIVAGREPIGAVTAATFPLPFDIPGLSPASIAVFPVEDHLSDKVWATVSMFGDRNSTRFRDLYDICAIARTTAVDAADLRTAVEEERLRRAAPELTRLEVPPEWEQRWPALHRSYGSEAHVPDDFAAAVALARSLVEPVLSGAISHGTWDHTREAWVS